MDRATEEQSGYAEELKVALAAAEEAGRMLRARFGDTWRVGVKGEDGDVVTELDLAAERIVLGRLREAFPEDRVWSEEAGVLAGAADRTWLVDPLDGSNNVAIGLPTYAVGIGLCVAGAPVLGVVHEPHTGATWHAVRGGGTHGRGGPLGGEGEEPGAAAGPPASGPASAPGPASTSAPASAVDPLPATRPVPAAETLPPDIVVPASAPRLVVAWTQGHSVRKDDALAEALRIALERRTRRVLALWAPLLGWSMLARGTIDGFVGYCAEAVDFPPGALLALEAGCEFRTLEGGPFRIGFTGPDTTRCFVAGRPGVLDRLVALTREAVAAAVV
ncbi:MULTISPECIES: inositol monophosphatase family protein [unclassified Streptomyces]|uniref:inositol monophosphatase family protein n=1 Tax=unclassified Streptomyces TaxID=2593676 RepID=UPI0004C6A55D|nr:inositol monophosphatase family protein [Streptomyces sp. NRRL F-5630]